MAWSRLCEGHRGGGAWRLGSLGGFGGHRDLGSEGPGATLRGLDVSTQHCLTGDLARGANRSTAPRVEGYSIGPRISPPGKTPVCTFTYASPLRIARITLAKSPAAMP